MKKEAFYISAGKAREYSLNFNIQSFIGRLMFNKKPPKKNGYCNLGSGRRYLKEYVNADFFQYKFLRKFLKKKVFHDVDIHNSFVDWELDLRFNLNCKDNHFDGIFLEHVLEHLNIIDAINLLKEVNRILKPGGIVRIVVPSLKIYSEYYLNGISLGDKFRMWDKCRAEAMWNVAYNYGHNCFYDYELLKKVLNDANFITIYESNFLESKDEMLKIDDEGRRWESLYVEAQK